MEIITGRTGEPHVYAADDAELYKLFLGDGDFCLVTGNQLEATMHGTNKVRIADGSLIMQGRLSKIRASDGYDELDLDIGTTGYKRVDLVVAEYSQTAVEREIEQGGETVTYTDIIEKVELKIVKGTPNASEFVPPSITTGDIDAGETHQMALWEIRLDGINFDSLVDRRIFLNTTPIQTALNVATQSVAQIQTMMSTLQSDVYEYADELIEGVSQGIKGQWKKVVTVSDASSAIAVVMDSSYTYAASDVVDVYLNGLRLVNSEYSISGSSHTINVTLTSTTFTGQMEVVATKIVEEV